jgi:hypothetical protein
MKLAETLVKLAGDGEPEPYDPMKSTYKAPSRTSTVMQGGKETKLITGAEPARFPDRSRGALPSVPKAAKPAPQAVKPTFGTSTQCAPKLRNEYGHCPIAPSKGDGGVGPGDKEYG